MLETVQETKFTFHAEDSKKDDQTGTIDTLSLKDMSGGIPKIITLAVGARVMLTKNIDVQDGLVNSASGEVTGFYPQPPLDQDANTFKPKYIFVKFTDTRVGRRIRLQSRRILPDDSSTPIPTVETQIRIGKFSKITAKRIQFPLCLAWAVTIHKEQGKTEDQLVVSCKGTFHAGQFYTSISRTKEMNGLYILGDPSANKVKVNTAALEEIKRMKKSSSFQPLEIHTINPALTHATHFKLQCMNVNSFLPHQQFIQKHDFIQDSHVTCLIETWLKPNDMIKDFPQHNSLRTDNVINTRQRSGGLLMLLHHDLHFLKQYHVHDIRTEHQIVVFATKVNPSVRTCVVSIYHNPKVLANHFFPELEKIISIIPQRLPSLIVGDFNIDMSSTPSTSTTLSALLHYYAFHPIISEPTHRKGRQLDNIFINFSTKHSLTDVVPTYYSDHFLISLAIPWTEFIH